MREKCAHENNFFFQWSEARRLYHPSQVQQFSPPPYPCQICNHRGFFFLFISNVNEIVQYYLHPLFFLLECPKYIPYFWRYRLAIETNYRNHVDRTIFFLALSLSTFKTFHSLSNAAVGRRAVRLVCKLHHWILKLYLSPLFKAIEIPSLLDLWLLRNSF